MNKIRGKTAYLVPVILRWKVVAGSKDLHPINLRDVILDDSDFKIRKMDPKTQEFIKYC